MKMAIKRTSRIPYCAMLLVVAAFALSFSAVFYLPSAGGRVKAQVLATAPTAALSGAKVDPLLVSHLSTSASGVFAPAVITYQRMPAKTELDRLRSVGIRKGFALKELPMVIVPMNAVQLAAVRTQPGVRSIWGNRIMKTFTNESRPFIGVPQLMADREATRLNRQNPGMAFSGKGIGIGYIDTGIDATHADLQYGTKTVQNVIQPISEMNVGDAGLALGVGINIFDIIYEETGFYSPVYLENQPHSDVESGHGTHGAAVAAGTGVQSGNFYGGVAPGAHLIGVNSGNEIGLPLVGLLGAYDYLLLKQLQYNIRVINNSWGTTIASSPEALDPSDPINIATRTAHDRNITVVFAAGNGIDSVGDVDGAINPYSTMPWTISVAAGYKRGLGQPTSFSSRGQNNGDGTDVAGMPADPSAKPNLRPDITAPGLDIKSARMKGPGLTNTAGAIPIFVGSNDLWTIPPAFLPFYTTSQGTSFACPHVSGVVALMLEANPTLMPDDVVTILRETANPMPYAEREVGAGYVDAHNAVRRALGLSAVPHPFNLFPDPNGPEIVDPEGDQVSESGINPAGTTEPQDILSADFAYDAATRQIVYTLTLKNLSLRTYGTSWVQSSVFKNPVGGAETIIFVTATTTQTGGTTFNYGKITLGAVNQQTNLGAADSGEIKGNQIIIRLSVDRLKANTALGYDVVGMTSTSTEARGQIGVGLLFASDIGNGRDFKVE
jgi:serine protease AprX